jgi:uncharacterized membrane protein HdeD (DUF308 family)
MSTDSRSAGSAEHRVSPWASGLAIFAGAMMIVSGIFAVFEGIAALFNDKVYVSTPQYLYAFDLTAWGWIHLLLGVLVGLAGVAVIRGQAWGRFTGIALAAVSLIANFLFLPHYPLWSIILIALDVAIIWALAVYRGDTV